MARIIPEPARVPCNWKRPPIRGSRMSMTSMDSAAGCAYIKPAKFGRSLPRTSYDALINFHVAIMKFLNALLLAATSVTALSGKATTTVSVNRSLTKGLSTDQFSALL